MKNSKFKILSFIVCITFVVSFSSCAQTNPTPSPTESLNSYQSAMNTGSAKKPEGKCLFINILLSDSESSFKDSESIEIREMYAYGLPNAFKFLQEKAMDYNKSFDPIFNEPDTMLHYEVDFKIPTSPENSAWVREIFDNIYIDLNIDDILEKYNADNIGFIYHINKTGRAFALPAYQSNTYEIAVVYTSKKPSDSDMIYTTSSSTYAHEILHLFGAIDLYELDDYRKSLLKEIAPYEIMFHSSYDFGDHTMSDITAYLIGWIDFKFPD